MRIVKATATSLLLSACLLLASPALGQMNPELYHPNADSKAEIAHAVQEAGRRHKRILLIFGANWCPDCHALDYRFHQEPIQSLVEKNFIVIHIDIGKGRGEEQGEKNVDLVRKYQVPIERGVPALAVLAGDGRLLYSQQNGEFEAARRLDPQQIVDFLNQWKPPAKG